jgi:hypothetical protein
LFFIVIILRVIPNHDGKIRNKAVLDNERSSLRIRPLFIHSPPYKREHDIQSFNAEGDL